MLSGFDESVRVPKKAEVVARRIAALITEQGLAPGTPVPNENEMLAQFRVARSTLREALRLLETQGVLSLQAGRSPTVRQPTSDELVNSLSLLLQFQGATFATLLRARVLFEPPIAAEAARNADAVDVAALRENIEAGRSDTWTSLSARVHNELDFHRVVANASKNPLATVMVATLLAVLHNGFSAEYPNEFDFDHEIEFHERVVDAIEAGQPDQAEALTRAHLEEVTKMVASRYPNMLRRPVRWI